MKEDILEQPTDDYLQFRGYFTMHNIKYRPRNDREDFVSTQDSNHSDIDVLGINPKLTGPDRVWAVSCKSWQNGLSPKVRIDKIDNNKIVSGREAWRGFRELVVPKWAEAFTDAVESLAGSREFTYVTAVTKLRGQRETWEQHKPFLETIKSPIRVLTFSDMLDELWPSLKTTVAPSDVGRTLQLIKASGWKAK